MVGAGAGLFSETGVEIDRVGGMYFLVFGYGVVYLGLFGFWFFD